MSHARYQGLLSYEHQVGVDFFNLLGYILPPLPLIEVDCGQ
jgi:hypothetical protein